MYVLPDFVGILTRKKVLKYRHALPYWHLVKAKERVVTVRGQEKLRKTVIIEAIVVKL